MNSIAKGFLLNKKEAGNLSRRSLPVCYPQGLHLADLIAEHPLDSIAHGFPAGGAEMDGNSVGGFTGFLHKRRAVASLRRQVTLDTELAPAISAAAGRRKTFLALDSAPPI